MEPGETIEAAVKRETEEETGINIEKLAYFGSQPHPFPLSLMIGFYARAVNTNIVTNKVLWKKF
jgi:NAD+ diphosphatase